MIEEGHGNLLTADVDALVNTVNTVGVMGKGIALQFKRAYPANYKAYRAACARDEVRLGRMFVVDSGALGLRRYVINFPTKGHWRSAARIEDIEAGLEDLVRVVRELGVGSIASPALGCGNGGLAWAEVRPLIERACARIPDVRAVVFAPAGAPAPASMPNATRRPRLTALRAQDRLGHVLDTLEGHYLTGFGDRSARVTELAPINPTAGAVEEAQAELDLHPDDAERVSALLALVDGFETPYSLELLATVHFAASQPPVSGDPKVLADRVAAWSLRKARLFTVEHVHLAARRLAEHELLPA